MMPLHNPAPSGRRKGCIGEGAWDRMTVVILAGGQSRRMGRDKLLLPLAGESLLERALRRWEEGGFRVLVSVAELEKYPFLGARRVPDTFPGAGPMAGLLAGLEKAGEGVFLTAADMPFSDPKAAREMIARCGSASACVLRDSDGRWEPLFGYYRPEAADLARQLLERGERRMQALLEGLTVCCLQPEELGQHWDARTLLNVNRPGDYEKLCLELERGAC